MSIREYKDKHGRTKYRVAVDIGATAAGKRDRLTKVCTTKKEAQKAELGFLMRKERLQGKSNRITFREFVDEHYLPVKRAALRKRTMREYESVIDNHLMDRFGNALIPDINRMQIQSMISASSSGDTAKRCRDMMRQILGEAVQMDIVQVNVAKGRFNFPAGIEVDDEMSTGEWVTSFAEHAAIIDKAQGWELRMILVLGFCFGLRKGEILGLDWKDIDFEDRRIRIRQSYVYTEGTPDLDAPKTPKSKRVIPMTDYAYRQLEVLRKTAPKRVKIVDGKKVPRIAPYVLTGRTGNRLYPSRASKIVAAFTASADVPHITIMTLRHSFATAAIRANINVAVVSKWLGHTNITTTYNKYVRPLLADLESETEAIDAAYRATG
jgi:integrase